MKKSKLPYYIEIEPSLEYTEFTLKQVRKRFYRHGTLRRNEELYYRQCGLCCYCNARLWLIRDAYAQKLFGSRTSFLATIDHFIPRSKGGTKQGRNAVLACNRCNFLKADLMPDVFMSRLPLREPK